MQVIFFFFSLIYLILSFLRYIEFISKDGLESIFTRRQCQNKKTYAVYKRPNRLRFKDKPKRPRFLTIQKSLKRQNSRKLSQSSQRNPLLKSLDSYQWLQHGINYNYRSNSRKINSCLTLQAAGRQPLTQKILNKDFCRQNSKANWTRDLLVLLIWVYNLQDLLIMLPQIGFKSPGKKIVFTQTKNPNFLNFFKVIKMGQHLIKFLNN